MKRLIETLSLLARGFRVGIVLIGVVFMAVLCTIGYSYLRGDIVGEVKLNFTSLISDEIWVYCCTFFLVVWMIGEAIILAIKVRAWRAYRKEIKQ